MVADAVLGENPELRTGVAGGFPSWICFRRGCCSYCITITLAYTHCRSLQIVEDTLKYVTIKC